MLWYLMALRMNLACSRSLSSLRSNNACMLLVTPLADSQKFTHAMCYTPHISRYSLPMLCVNFWLSIGKSVNMCVTASIHCTVCWHKSLITRPTFHCLH